MKKEKKLYRVDINLKYLIYTDKDYDQDDVVKWLREDFHHAELDDNYSITQVKEAKEVEDFSEMDIEYCPYYTDPADESLYLCEIIKDLGLDASELIERLKSLGYKVTKK